ncbi:intermembrane transport protein PqiB [Roseomonas sp. AR75]|uniref:PqiB family protein n=1 Tax=Roseomonas sp. AR75 TaxID=2562311 RepID=UPI0010BFE8D1|nr:MlaD family protein [Roseomonas sp. AR75]
MNDSPHPEATVRARVGRSRRVSPIWAIPLVTVLIAGYLVWHEFSKRGPLITVTFHSAEGLTAGQSQVRLRDVTVGTVQSIALSQDRQRVELSIRMDREAEPLLTEDARFWVVKPRLFAGSISGLSTLLSGSYIQVAPGKPESPPARRYTGLEDPPLLNSDEPGRTLLLRADRLGSLSLGSPIFFRDLSVGQVLGWDLADMAQHVTIHAFIRAPFDRYVHEGTRFWNASGVSLKLGAEGVQVQLESLRALVLGGIAFETPDAAQRGPMAAADQVFRLYASQEAANNASVTRRIPVVSYFTDSVGGLAPGAPVQFQGVRIGEVIGYDLVYDAATDRLRIPVRYEIEPDRIAGSSAAEHRGPLENAQMLVRQGLRARLASANLLTGQQLISLEVVANAGPAEVRVTDGVIEMPTAPGQFASILDGVNQVLARIEALPLQQIGDNLNETIAGVNTLVRGPELAGAIASLQGTLATAEQTLRQIDAAAAPALRTLPQLVTSLNNAATQAGRLMTSVNRGYGDESQFRRDLDRMLDQITTAARSLRSLADQLNRNPEALIRGRSTQGP